MSPYSSVWNLGNCRSITKASIDPNDLEVLTPNHLLLLKYKPLLPPGLFQRDDIYARCRWKQVQYMSDLFWKCWVNDYLPQEWQKWQSTRRNFVPGNVVIVVDDSAPCNSWLTARVVQAVPDIRGFFYGRFVLRRRPATWIDLSVRCAFFRKRRSHEDLQWPLGLCCRCGHLNVNQYTHTRARAHTEQRNSIVSLEMFIASLNSQTGVHTVLVYGTYCFNSD